jgi:hypothetical protein
MKRFVVQLITVLLWASAAHAASTLTVSWQDNSENEDGFNIERATSTSGPFNKIGSVSSNVTNFTDTGLTEATNYCYRVNAFNPAGVSVYTPVVCGITKATLNLVKAGTGSGNVTSTPAGLSCSSACTTQFSGNSNVTLTSKASAGSVFAGWSGACSGTGSCTVTMNAQKSVTAIFVNSGTSQAAKNGTDYDGDGQTDITVYRKGAWYVRNSSNGSTTTIQWGGEAQDIPVPSDYDGDGKSDMAIYRDGTWFISRSSDGQQITVRWGGAAQDIPVPADYDGDGKADLAVYNSASAGWSIIHSSNGGFSYKVWGGPAWIPVEADYDGDGKVDIAVYNANGLWSIVRSSDGGNTLVRWSGAAQDIPVPADYDGDGKADLAVYNSASAGWSIIHSSNGGFSYKVWGGPAWEPVVADYDGDRKADIAVYNASNGLWSIVRSSDGYNAILGWGGGPNDIPLN